MTSIIDTPINIYEIMKQIPHRFPFLLIDRVLELEPGKRIRMLKNITINEPFFTGHFPGFPVMPGVLIVEAMAQSAGVLSVLTNGPRKANELYFFAGIDNAKFKRQVIPGDALHIEVKMIKITMGIGKYRAQAFVGDDLVAQADLLVAKKEIKNDS
ncbi:MAG: fabZ [Burkholderiales bacterium]|jgi:3-hydroxyacyl-[acyl-carrier-protein] dehydratase|nr:fabZ [Burkholderiales bacterium]